jgi:hypothetical protein
MTPTPTPTSTNQTTLILSDRHELAMAKAFCLDCVADNMPIDEAIEIIDSWSSLQIARWAVQNYGCVWSERGPNEYR